MMMRAAVSGAVMLLLAGTALSAQPTSRAPKPKEKLICKSFQETGSIAKRQRQCFTKQEWDRIAEAARARGQRLTSDMASGMISN